MNKVDFMPRADAAGHSSVGSQRRSPPKAVKVLLPVWGYAYVCQFLGYGLPTLLAPGNVPGLAAALPTEFVLLTSADDEAFIREHPTFKRLAAACETRIQPIDHLITDGNYSTTITLAYTEAVREAGEAMVDTCFFFLVSDYIMADGSLLNALKRMQAGASAVVVGNFQVASEEALPWLQQKLAGKKPSLALSSRELMQWALRNVHPTALANTVNIPFSHNSHTNRLFWRVDGSTILGRFYLMHMLCVRPEVTDFIIGSSCDYSFVPEMCPSGNVEAVTDSDEYLVIEIQPRHHESAFLRPGPLKASALAKSLSEWTTSVHRQNVRHTLIFHADRLPTNLASSIEAADALVADVADHLKRSPQPHRGHPYWHGAMATFYDATGRRLDEHEWRYALGLPAGGNRLTTWLLYHAKFSLMGRPPHVLPWHPVWPDYQIVFRELGSFFTERRQRLLILSNEPTAFSLALADGSEQVHRLRCNPFVQSRPERYAPLHGKFDLCLLELGETDMRFGDKLVDRIVPLMKNGGRIIVFVLNRRREDEEGEFVRSVMYHSPRFIRSGALPTEVHFVPANVARWRARQGMFNLRTMLDKRPWLGPLAVAGGGVLLALSLVGNLDSMRRTRRVAPKGHTSSFVMRLSVDAPKIAGVQAPPFSADTRQQRGRSKNQPSNADVRWTEATEETHAAEYDRCIELKNTVGLSSLGLMTNQIWYDDPRRLGVLLARYQFVAKLLSGRANAAEVGCGDAFGTRLVVQAVPDVTVYGCNSEFVEDIRSRQDDRWPLRAELHDILTARLPREHEALFSLDLIEQLAPEDEHLYLVNLCGSLASNGMLIIGVPAAAESPIDGRPSGAAGDINRKSGNELKALLEHYFAQVFMFSMSDDVVQAGLAPMAHYLFAVCTGPKWEEGILRHEKSPLFEICEWRRGAGFCVRVTHPNSEPQIIEGFATVADAARWISTQTLDWFHAGRPASY